ncbi:hypothetical protein [Actinokineospora sp.]|uniref:hypothetical protein n=1 Tax=Actinokineospora sp. TaxID=1872133 RepID=UPI0040383DAA
MAERIGRDGTLDPEPGPLLPDPLAGLVTGERFEPRETSVRLTVPDRPADIVVARTDEPRPARPAARPRRATPMPTGMIHYPPRIGWPGPAASRRSRGAPRTRGSGLNLTVTLSALIVFLVIAYFIVSSFVAMLNGFAG